MPIHIVRDGDTLSDLARGYLGSSSRYMEIFEANRDILRSAELLPIGAGLRIPTAKAPWSREAAPQGTVAAPPTSTQTRTPTAASGRTHRVARAETLTAIAHRYYGDAMRYELIYEANRDVLKNPHALVEGMELVIPESPR